MLTKVFAAAVQGIQAQLVTIEVCTSRGIKFFLVGMPDEAVRESHERIVAAFRHNNLNFPSCQITINMAPADVRKEGASYDLPLAIGIMVASGMLKAERLERFLLMGELSLDGTLQPVSGILPMALMAHRLGFEGLILPAQNAQEAAVVEGIDVYGASHLSQVVELLGGQSVLQPVTLDREQAFASHHLGAEPDFSDVRGQEQVKRAFEVAAAGLHNIILVGPPGSGKSMMAKRLSGILPPLSVSECLETTQVHSVAGFLSRGEGLVTDRPFRAPHHSISHVALVGGGQNPRPGEISLAHNGVLFLDELPEFNRSTLEVLRQPLEDRRITISRISYTVDYPCSFMLVASMNPCPCGYLNHPTRACTCLPGQVHRYLNRVSGPLMDRIDQNGEFPNKTIPHRFSQERRKKCVRNPDHIFLDRIDIQCEIQPVPFSDLANAMPGESSAVIRERVLKARALQFERFREYPGIHCNAQMTEKLLRQYCQLDEKTNAMLQKAMTQLTLSARAYSRILKVARTIADLDGKPCIEMHHVAEAIGYRTLDRGDWAIR